MLLITMSPTLLEVTVAVLLLWLAWQIGLLIAPRVFRYFKTIFGRADVRAGGAAGVWPEKNVTPRPDPTQPTHGHPPTQ